MREAFIPPDFREHEAFFMRTTNFCSIFVDQGVWPSLSVADTGECYPRDIAVKKSVRLKYWSSHGRTLTTSPRCRAKDERRSAFLYMPRRFLQAASRQKAAAHGSCCCPSSRGLTRRSIRRSRGHQVSHPGVLSCASDTQTA
jgi:hypothetical protein